MSFKNVRYGYQKTVSKHLNKCDVTDTLLPHGAAEVGFQSEQRTE